MQARHRAMTAAGLIVLHSSPRQIRTESRRLLTELEDCYHQAHGRGLPVGVKLLRTEAA